MSTKDKSFDLDNEFLMDFFLTFRQFLTPIKLCKLLILRFRWALLEEEDVHRLVRIRYFLINHNLSIINLIYRIYFRREKRN
jgi:hypothetical protein